tara:strand:+ start:1555 stop:2934 length:1380 start_codon:yes stop_codon:yes gene_type:complete
MKKILPFALFWISFIGFAQCPTTDIYLETQADIDNFAANYPNCSLLASDLWIGTEVNDITNLNGLASIISAQNIYMRYTEVSNFSGLNNMEDVLQLSIWFNNDMTNLDGLASLRSIVGLQIFVSSSITDLSGLDSIETIENLDLFSNPALSDISQLSFLETVNSLTINSNALGSLNGLENLHTVFEDLTISNESLENFNELSSLQTIGGSLNITNNMLLNDVTAFNNIVLLDELYVVRCPNLSNFSGLENIQDISGRLRIGYNTTLTDMSVFSNLNSVGDLDIYDNDNLVSLSGLGNLQFVSNRLFVSRNILLSSIDALNNLSTSQINQVAIINNVNLVVCSNLFMCTVIADPSVLKSIYNNNVGCNTLEEVETACNLSISEKDLNEAIAVFPNPVSDLLYVNISDGIGLERIAVFSILGQQLIDSKGGVVNFSSLSKGVYFVEVYTDRGRINKKVVKR